MEARRRSSAPVLPLAFFLPSSHSPTRHSNSPSSSSAFNFAVHRILSPTRATFTGDSSYFSSASAAASSYISFSFDGSASQVRSSGLPISPNGGATKKACMCSPTNHPGSFRCSLHKNSNNSPSSTQSHLNARRSTMTNSLIRIGGVECEEVYHDEFADKNRRCRRRMGQKSPHVSHTPLHPPHTKEIVFSAAAKQALPCDHEPRSPLKLASDSLPFQRTILACLADHSSNGSRVHRRKIGIYSCIAAPQFCFPLMSSPWILSHM